MWIRRASHDQARELIKDLTVLTDLPVRWVVNTHYHWDHCWGNALFRSAELWGHAQHPARHLLERRGEARRRVIDQLPVEHHRIRRGRDRTSGAHLFGAGVARYWSAPSISDITAAGTRTVISPSAVADVVFAGDLVEEAAPPSFGDALSPRLADRARRPARTCGGSRGARPRRPVDRAFVVATAGRHRRHDRTGPGRVRRRPGAAAIVRRRGRSISRRREPFGG